MVSLIVPFQTLGFGSCPEARWVHCFARAEARRQATWSCSFRPHCVPNFRKFKPVRVKEPSGDQEPRGVRCKDASTQQNPSSYRKWRTKSIEDQPKNENGCFSNSISEEREATVIRRPRRIILVRHGQSIGNVDEGSYTRIPDSKIPLTEAGWHQALDCGETIRRLIESDAQEDDWQVYFYVSPYKRTLQTLRGIGTAFERSHIAGVREEPRLREQDFGNFQDREKMRVEKEVRLRYGRFFYRFPNGESASDVYDRITAFRETLRTDIDIGRFQSPSKINNMNLVLVSHGLTLRVFLTRWYRWTVKQFEGLHNFSNAGMMVMELGPGGRYSLLIHHSAKELKAFGMTDEMINDQEWQKYAKPGELNDMWLTSESNSSFFSHFENMENGLPYKDVPADVVQGGPAEELLFNDKRK